MRRCLCGGLLILTSCGGGETAIEPLSSQTVSVSLPPALPVNSPASTAPQAPPNPLGQNLALSAAGWIAGPTINGFNRSVGTWLTDEENCLVVNIPSPNAEAGTANYITRYVGGLADASAIYIDFELVAPPGTKLLPRDGSNLPSLLTIYFQRTGDNWYADAATETYRWWASPKTVVDIQPGQRYRIRQRFDETWTAVLTSTSHTKPFEFAQARAYATQVGFTLGGGDGLGHGVYATNPARIVVHEFRVE